MLNAVNGHSLALAAAFGGSGSHVYITLGALALAGLATVAWWRTRTGARAHSERAHRARIREQARINKTTAELLDALESAAKRAQAELDRRLSKIASLDPAPSRVAPAPPEPAPHSAARHLPEPHPSAAHQLELSAAARQQPPHTDQPAVSNAAGGERTQPRAAVAVPFQPARTTDTQVLALSATGRTPTQIAQELRLPLGEVELVLDLQKYSG